MSDLEITTPDGTPVFQSPQAQAYFKKLLHDSEHMDEIILGWLRAVVDNEADIELRSGVVLRMEGSGGDRPKLIIEGKDNE